MKWTNVCKKLKEENPIYKTFLLKTEKRQTSNSMFVPCHKFFGNVKNKNRGTYQTWRLNKKYRRLKNK